MPAVFTNVPASMWGAMAGRSPHEAIFLQDTALDMNPYEMIVASLDVQGAFHHAPHRLRKEVCNAISLPFLSSMTGYIHTRLYALITAAGLSHLDRHRQQGPPGWRRGPLPLHPSHPPAGILAGTGLPGIRPVGLRSSLINFADDTLLTTATHHRDPANCNRAEALAPLGSPGLGVWRPFLLISACCFGKTLLILSKNPASNT